LKTSFTRSKNETKWQFTSKKSFESGTRRNGREGLDWRKRPRRMELSLMRSI